MVASAHTASACLLCKYSLDGLPERHHCPECGEAYDELSHVYEKRSNNWLLFLMTSFGMSSWAWLLLDFQRQLSLPWWRVVIEWGLGVFVVTGSLMSTRLWFRRIGQKQSIAALPDRLRLQLDGEEIADYRWDEISTAVVRKALNGSYPELALVSGERKAIVTFLRRRAVVVDLVRLVRRRLRDHRRASAQEPVLT